MKLSPTWIRDFVDLKVDNATLAHDLTSIGIAVEGISGEGGNTVFEMEIGTNRPDAMNHYGIAREAAAFYGAELRPIDTPAPEAVYSGASIDSAKVGPFQIEIEDKEGCARYTAQIICGVKIKPSPEKIASRLSLIDQRPINNAADA